MNLELQAETEFETWRESRMTSAAEIKPMVPTSRVLHPDEAHGDLIIFAHCSSPISEADQRTELPQESSISDASVRIIECRSESESDSTHTPEDGGIEREILQEEMPVCTDIVPYINYLTLTSISPLSSVEETRGFWPAREGDQSPEPGPAREGDYSDNCSPNEEAAGIVHEPIIEVDIEEAIKQQENERQANYMIKNLHITESPAKNQHHPNPVPHSYRQNERISDPHVPDHWEELVDNADDVVIAGVTEAEVHATEDGTPQVPHRVRNADISNITKTFQGFKPLEKKLKSRAQALRELITPKTKRRQQKKRLQLTNRPMTRARAKLIMEEQQPTKLDKSSIESLQVRRVTHGTALMVNMNLGDITFPACLDTGCECILVPRPLLEQTSIPYAPGDIIELTLANGQTVQGRSNGRCKFTIGDQEFEEEIIISEYGAEILLGSDFCEQNEAEISFKSNTLSLNGSLTPLISPQEHKPRKVCAVSTSTIQPMEIARLEADIDGRKPMKALFCTGMIRHNGLLCLNARYEPGQKVSIWCANMSNRKIKVRRAMCLAETHDLTPEESLKSPDETLIRTPNVESLRTRACALEGESTDSINTSSSNMPETETPLTDQPIDVTDEEVANFNPDFIPEFLRDLYERSKGLLDERQKARFGKLLITLQDAFSKDENDIGKIRGYVHKLNTGDAKPVKQPIWRPPLHLRAEEEAELKRMLNLDVIRPCISEWQANPVLVRKRGEANENSTSGKNSGPIRYCISYKGLNKVLAKDHFPIPKISEVLNFLSGNSIFSTIDCTASYWQLQLAPEDQEKTAFQTRWGTYCWNRCPFGLSTSGAGFSRAMTEILHDLLYKIVVAYLDDIIIPSKSIEDQFLALETVLRRLIANGAKAKPNKCLFFQPQIEALGRIATGGQIEIAERHIAAVKDWPTPHNKKTLQRFLGFVNYHREWLKNLASIAKPLYKHTKKKSKFHWGKAEDKAFRTIRNMLISPPVLVLPTDQDDFILDTDGSANGLGAVLSQVQDGKERVVAYASATTTADHKHMCATRLELLAVVKFTRHFRQFLIGRPFVCRSDHQSLLWLHNFKHGNSQLARWLEELSQYEMILRHRPGRKHANADALSRLLLEPSHYTREVKLEDLPCGGCDYCRKAQNQWKEFNEEVDTVYPFLKTSGVNLILENEETPTLTPGDTTAFQSLLEEGKDCVVKEEKIEFPPNAPQNLNCSTSTSADSEFCLSITQEETQSTPPASPTPSATPENTHTHVPMSGASPDRDLSKAPTPRPTPENNQSLVPTSGVSPDRDQSVFHTPTAMPEANPTQVPTSGAWPDQDLNTTVTESPPPGNSHIRCLTAVPSPEKAQTPALPEQLLHHSNDGQSAALAEPSVRPKLVRKAQTQPEPSTNEILANEEPSRGNSWGWSNDLMRKAQIADPHIGPIYNWLKTNAEPSLEELQKCARETKSYWTGKQLLRFHDNVLYMLSTNNLRDRLLLPKRFRKEALRLQHDVPSAAHPGFDRTLERIKQRFVWFGLRGDVMDYVNSCVPCNLNKSLPKPGRHDLVERSAADRLEVLHIDYMGPLPRTSSGARYILMMVDKFTKWVEAVPTQDCTAETTADALLQVFYRIGFPQSIVSDRGKSFENNLIKQLCRTLGISKERTTPYRPSANGQCERLNRVLMASLRCCLEKARDDWHKFVPQIAAAIRSTVNRSTGYTPNFLMFGQEINLPVDIVFGAPHPRYDEEDVHKYVKDMRASFREAYELARECIQGVSKVNKSRHDLRTFRRQYSVGEAVYMLDKTIVSKPCKKLRALWKGPGIITDQFTSYLYRVRVRGNCYTVHHDHLKKCRLHPLPLWIQRAQRTGQLKPKAPKSSGPICICGEEEGTRSVVKCSFCNEKYHDSCVNISPEDEEESTPFQCPRCEGSPAIHSNTGATSRNRLQAVVEDDEPDEPTDSVTVSTAEPDLETPQPCTALAVPLQEVAATIQAPTGEDMTPSATEARQPRTALAVPPSELIATIEVPSINDKVPDVAVIMLDEEDLSPPPANFDPCKLC